MRPVNGPRRAPARKAPLLWAAIALLPLTQLAAATVSVNAGTKYQTIDGFGAATAWNGISTTQAPVLWTDDSAALVSNTSAHVNGHAGLSIVRMRIDPNEEANGTSAWNGELNQLVLARKTNPSITEFATAWTPPSADKENHSNQELNSSDPTNCFNGLPTTNNGTAGVASADSDYAAYLVKFVQYANSYLPNNGASGSLNVVSVQNEPDWNTTYESALWTGPQFDTFVGSYLGPSMQSAGLLSATKIMVTESFHDSLSLASNTMNDANAAPFVGFLAGHLYGSTTPPPTLASANFTHLTNQHYWETEISDLGSGTQDITTGLEEAGWIYNCIVLAGMNGYNHWWINSTGKDGFYNTSSNSWNHNFFVEGNFSKFVRPGFVRIGSTNFPEGGNATANAPVWTAAFESPSATRVVVVAVNNSTSAYTETISLSGVGTVTQVAPWLTSSGSNLVQQSLVPVSGGSFSYTLPAQSVITFVGDSGNPPTPSPSPSRTTPPTASPTPSHSPTATRTPSPIPTPNACSYLAGVACGASAAYTSTQLGRSFGADQQYAPGSAPGAAGSYGYVSWAAGTAYTATATIVGGDAADATLYETQRYGTTLGYDFSVPNGPAYVTFYWAETYATALGQRVFSVSINGATVEAALDLYATAGANNTYSVTFPVTVTNGVISIVGTASANNAEFQGIAVQAGPGCSPTPTITLTGTTPPTATRTPTASASPTRSRTASPLPSATATPTLQPPTATDSPSPALPSATATPTTQAPTATDTRSPAVPSATATPTLQAPTATATPSPAVPSATATSTLQAPTATATPSPAVPSATATPTVPVSTATETRSPVVPSATATPTPTLRAPTATATPTVQAPTATRTASPVVPSATPTRSPTLLPSLTASPTRIPTPPRASATATPYVNSGNGPPNILRALPVPNPNPTSISVQLDGRADYVDVKVYSLGMNLVAEDAVGTGGPGWLQVPLPPGFAGYVAAGTYYYAVQAFKSGVGSKAVTGTVVVLH